MYIMFITIVLLFIKVKASDVNVTYYNPVSYEDIRAIEKLPCTIHPVHNNALWSCDPKFYPKSALLFGTNATHSVVCTVKAGAALDLLALKVRWMARSGK